MVWGPEVVAVAQVQQLRSSPVFARLRPYIERAACIQLADWEELLAATRRLALAARAEPEGDGQQWLLVLEGRYSEPDARRLLRAALEEAPREVSPGPITRDNSGRFTVAEERELAVSLLEERIIVLGTKSWVYAAVDSIAQPTAKFSDAALWREIGAQAGCSARAACVLSVANGMSARALQSGLSQAGAKGLAAEVQAADSALTLGLSEGLDLGIVAQLGSGAAAAAAERELRNWLWQANLLIRLTGMPAILDTARLSSQDALVRAELNVSPSDVEAYDARGRPLFDRVAPACADPAPPTP